MVAPVNRQILLKSRPEGAPSLDNFALVQGSVPEPGGGEVLMRTLWLSLDRQRSPRRRTFQRTGAWLHSLYRIPTQARPQHAGGVPPNADRGRATIR